VDTGRRFVTWNVVAAPEFSLDAKKWCFPVAGCITYRGYFARDAARAYGADLRAQGLDVAVNGVAAYSTLGWFDDPVLNTMLRWRDDRLVGLIFHELAHQKLYVKDDSDFNEAFAVFIEREGMKRWLEQRGSPAQQLAYQQQSVRKAQFLALLENTRTALAILYEQDIPESQKRRRKSERFAELLHNYTGLKQAWGGYTGYDNWFGRELNNARLVSVATYNDLVPVFETLMTQSAGNLATFYDRAEALGRLPAKQRTRRLQKLGAKPGVDG
jgi:predicted aminopeptidase